MDDTLLGGDTFDKFKDNVFSTLTFLEDMGFCIHPKEKKKQKIKGKVEELRTRSNTVREVSSLLGCIVASFEAVPNVRLHYRHTEFDKIFALKQNKGNLEAKCYLSPTAIAEPKLWKDSILEVYRVWKSIPEVDYTIYSDTSTKDWGAHDKHHTTNGRWTEGETKLHIDVLELTTLKFAIFFQLPLQLQNRIMTDNSTAVSYINRQGGVRSMLCKNVTTEIWEFDIEMDIYISAAHIPGKENIIADLASRKFQDSHEWMLSLEVFKYLVELFQVPHIDMFTSRLSKQLLKYASWIPDPDLTSFIA